HRGSGRGTSAQSTAQHGRPVVARGRDPRFSDQREATTGVGGAHSTACTCRTTKLAGREGALVRGALQRVKGQEIGVSRVTPPKLQRLQEALYTKAKQEPAYRFYLLYDKVYRADILAHAYALSQQHGGAPGVDGVTFEDIEGEGLERWLAAVQEALRTQTYRPQPVRRVLIPKPGGGERPLGIPTIRDRVVQTAALLILRPIFEAEPAAGGGWRYSGGKRATRGTPQGGVISPLLANLYMNRYLKVFRLRGLDRRYGARLVNYADDFVVLCRYGAAEVLAQSRRWFAQMGLTLNEQKTRVCDGRRESFTFLGYTFGPMRYRKDGHWYLGAAPAKKAVKRI